MTNFVKDLISVIVPCYNSEKWISDCLKSIENQTYKNIEVIFVNDGSKDNTLEILQNYGKQNPKVKVLTQENGGVCKARNNGLAHAVGEYIYFCDDDDMFAPNLLERLHDSLVESKCQLAACQRKYVSESTCYEEIKPENSSEQQVFTQEEALCRLLCRRESSFAIWNKLYKHEIVSKMENYPNVFDERLIIAEDGLFNFKYIALCKDVVYLKQRLYFYRMRKGSAIHTKMNDKLLSSFIATDYMIDFCAEKHWVEVKKYAVLCKCMYCHEMLIRTFKNGKYKNKQEISKIYQYYKQNAKIFKQCKLAPKSMQIFYPHLPRLLRFLISVRWIFS